MRREGKDRTRGEAKPEDQRKSKRKGRPEESNARSRETEKGEDLSRGSMN